MASVLGLSFGYHDSAACLVKDGVLVAAMQEERFTRIKNDASYPRYAIEACLKQAGITAQDLDRVVFYEDIFLKAERVLRSAAAHFPQAWKQFPKAISSQFGNKIWILDQISSQLGIARNKIGCVEHHLSHAASCFYPSPFERAAIVTVDGVGEHATTSIWKGEGPEITHVQSINYPHSVGLLYAAVTAYLGFEVNSGEYKVMGLAAFGEPIFKDEFAKMVQYATDGSYHLNLDYFAHHTDTEMGFSEKMEELLGPRRTYGKPWDISQPDDKRYADIAATLQWLTEELMLGIVRTALSLTGCEDVCMAGGVALNCVANTRLLKESGVKRMFVQPAAGDAGGALGAAAWGAVQAGDGRIKPMTTAALGMEADSDRAIAICKDLGLSYSTPDNIYEETATLLAEHHIVAFVQGRFEWGPRALGMRSILARPDVENMRDRLNMVIKKREIFRPFAPAVLKQEAAHWFDDIDDHMSPYMTSIARIKADKAGQVPACVHVDGSCRAQTVDEQSSPAMYQVLTHMQQQTGTPIVINTSLNVNKEPIIASEIEALHFFLSTPVEAIIIGNVLVRR
jgi:carbamoyltransferase